MPTTLPGHGLEPWMPKSLPEGMIPALTYQPWHIPEVSKMLQNLGQFDR